MAFSSILADLAEEGEAPPARVLIVDDSVVARTAMARMVDATSRFVVAGAVGNAREALAFLALHQVEIILLDLEMPGVDGLTALPDMVMAGRGAKVLVVSSNAADGAAATVQALALGAADTLEKPSTGFARRFGEMLEERLGRLAEVAPEPVMLPATPVPARVLPKVEPFDIVAIGASTGGIHALSKLLRAIPSNVTVPMLITQHLPASFMPYFAAQLALIAGRPCEVATDGLRIRAGRIIVAPGDAHLCCVKAFDGAAVRLSTAPSNSGCLPSVDPMFASVAAVFGARALGVVLSGMGRDGSIGARDLVTAGGSVLVQDRTTSVVWGMPGAVANGAGATAVLPPDDIGRVIAARGTRP